MRTLQPLASDLADILVCHRLGCFDQVPIVTTSGQLGKIVWSTGRKGRNIYYLNTTKLLEAENVAVIIIRHYETYVTLLCWYLAFGVYFNALSSMRYLTLSWNDA